MVCAETHRHRGRCGGPLDLHPSAEVDETGRAWVPGVEACAGSGSLDLRLYRCPIVGAREVSRTMLPALYAATQGGLPVAALGQADLSEGAVDAVSALREAWQWRTELVVEVARQRARIKGSR